MGGLCSHGGADDEKEEPAGSPASEDPGPPQSIAALTNHADVRLCKLGCGCQVQEGLYRGRPFDTCCRSCALSPGAGVHDAKCRGPPPGGAALISVAGASVGARPVCAKGARCKRRVLEHLRAEAHPLDKDYSQCCQACGMEPEEPSLKLLFDWADADGSGKLTKEELSATLHIINSLSGDDDPEDTQEISDEAWKKLDEDGNGLVNFNEFACWAGPRLGLPLGVKKMISRSQTQGALVRPCGVYNCPCENYCEGLLGRCSVCKHKCGSHVSKAHTGEIPFPEYWDNHGEAPHALVDMQGMVVQDFQKLVDRTYRNSWTRDRSRHNENKKVPSGFKVKAVHRNENCDSWQEYCVRRASLLTRVQEGTEDPIEIKADVKTMVAWKDIMTDKADRLAPELNEWYLFHGTNPKAAQAICSSDFKLSFAGGNTGTLYGRGLYFAESFTKSDEYAKSNESGTYAMLMCRILGGRFKYTDLVSPDVEELVQSVTEGPYDTILGDREKCRGTYREFVIFDTEDVYPEYLIEYQRVYS
mmetsp:Transcript_79479/g.233613  ORF Transcript_79479/g.233613 Transcript_79479/m.233613 type:complete len:530 (+) Transcript_79479:79-1668(+)